MDLLSIIKQRHSVRKFQQKEIEQDKLDYVLECARLAPSAANIQPWKFFILKSQQYREEITKSYPAKWFSENRAPVILVACADTAKSWKRSYDGKNYADVDIAIAFEHICLAATEVGLGTCWIAHFDPEVVKRILNLDKDVIPIAITPIGYPETGGIKPTSRKSLNEITVVL